MQTINIWTHPTHRECIVPILTLPHNRTRYLNIGSESKLKEWADKLNVCCYQIIKERKELIRNGGSLEHKTDLLS
ncbi:hypothetical protein SARC_17855, partial [Sphaeroforma arctica JP610]